MLTPQELEACKFEKTMVWGYDMASVDTLLTAVRADYGALYKENIALKSKMKVLATKVEEYRSVDDAMRKALLRAQNIAEEEISAAEKKAAEILEKANLEAGKITHLATVGIDEEKRRYDEARRIAQDFIKRTLVMYDKQTVLLTELMEREFGQEDSEIKDDASEDIRRSIDNAMPADEWNGEIKSVPEAKPEETVPVAAVKVPPEIETRVFSMSDTPVAPVVKSAVDIPGPGPAVKDVLADEEIAEAVSSVFEVTLPSDVSDTRADRRGQENNGADQGKRSTFENLQFGEAYEQNERKKK